MTRELTLKRFYWNRGNVGDGVGHSNKVSIKLVFDWRDWRVGFYWPQSGFGHVYLFLMPLPMFAIKIHWARAWGGRYV